MKRRFGLEIGGVGVRVSWPGGAIDPWDFRRYTGFKKDRSPEIQFRVRFGRPPPIQMGDLLFEAPKNWRLVREDGQLGVAVYSLKTGSQNLMAFSDPRLTNWDVLMRPTSSLARLMIPLGEIVLAHYLTQRGDGVLCHGAGVNDRGKGYLFLGYPGAGKSTLSRFWRKRSGVILLGDDRIILRREGNTFRLYGTPWGGEVLEVHPGPVDLEAIYIIHHAERHERQVEGNSLVPRLFPHLFLPYWNGEAIGRAIQLLEEVVQSVPCHGLGFAKEEGVVDFIRGGR